jgi:uncharacterized protein YbjT (DUF2867 family)
MDAAYYLVHSMGGRSIRQTLAFAEKDRVAARNFIQSADAAGLSRVIYLGGLGDVTDKLSHHLASRQEVGRILQSGRVKTTILRAAVIIGAGGVAFEIVRYLVERLPVMVCPRWVITKSQPIAVENVLAYLAGCLENPATAGLSLDIGGPQILSYADLFRMYARVRGLKRIIIGRPLCTLPPVGILGQPADAGAGGHCVSPGRRPSKRSRVPGKSHPGAGAHPPFNYGTGHLQRPGRGRAGAGQTALTAVVFPARGSGMNSRRFNNGNHK